MHVCFVVALYLLLMEPHQASENAKRILGEAGWEQIQDAAVPADWLTVQRGRDLFLPGWGGFDVSQAFDASQAAGAHIPSVAELRSASECFQKLPKSPFLDGPVVVYEGGSSRKFYRSSPRGLQPQRF